MNIYDNSNLSESYAGATTPLTFSFAKRVYSGVYRYFAKTLGVNHKTIKENAEMFDNMVVFIGHHMYYDLNNWYKLISFLPGYKQNKKFFEKMLGVKKQHADKLKNKSNIWNYFILLPFLLFRLFIILFYFLFMSIFVYKFNRYFDNIYSRVLKIDLKTLDTKGLKDLFLSLDRQLISRWSIPIVNDFVVMVYTGISDVLARKWLKENNIYNLLFLQVHGKLSSLDPSRHLFKIAQEISNDKNLKDIFSKEEELITKIIFEQQGTCKISSLINEYLVKFGSRSPNELKLETETINENPAMLISILKTIVSNYSSEYKIFEKEDNDYSEIFKKLSWGKRFVFKRLLILTAKSIKNREETRFRRSMIFGYIRKIFLEIGTKFVDQNKIEDKSDIFFLSIQEIFDLMDAKSCVLDLKKIDARKKDFIMWQKIDCPRRIETEKNLFEIEKDILKDKFVVRNFNNTALVLSGTVASVPNGLTFVEGEALVMKSFDSKGDFKDKILVARQTDPGWTIIFPFLKGVIVERGGMLSHASIVARELNIPCVVGVENATELIRSREKININLLNGEISHHE